MELLISVLHIMLIRRRRCCLHCQKLAPNVQLTHKFSSASF